MSYSSLKMYKTPGVIALLISLIAGYFILFENSAHTGNSVNLQAGTIPVQSINQGFIILQKDEKFIAVQRTDGNIFAEDENSGSKKGET